VAGGEGKATLTSGIFDKVEFFFLDTIPLSEPTCFVFIPTPTHLRLSRDAFFKINFLKRALGYEKNFDNKFDDVETRQEVTPKTISD
jgi:hypothetical protein